MIAHPLATLKCRHKDGSTSVLGAKHTPPPNHTPSHHLCVYVFVTNVVQHNLSPHNRYHHSRQCIFFHISLTRFSTPTPLAAQAKALRPSHHHPTQRVYWISPQSPTTQPHNLHPPTTQPYEIRCHFQLFIVLYSPHIITTYTGATTTHPLINPQNILLCTQVSCLCPHTGTSLSRKGIHYINAILKKIAMQLPPGESLVPLNPSPT